MIVRSHRKWLLYATTIVGVFLSTSWTWLLPRSSRQSPLHRFRHIWTDPRVHDYPTDPITRGHSGQSSTALHATKNPTKSLTLRQTVDHIRETVLLSEIVGQYVSDIRDGYGGQAQCLCPFHDDHNPSMSISDTKGVYHCFACGAGGNIFSFVERQEGCSFPEAVQHLVDLADLDVEIVPDNGEDAVSLERQSAESEAQRRLELALKLATR